MVKRRISLGRVSEGEGGRREEAIRVRVSSRAEAWPYKKGGGR